MSQMVEAEKPNFGRREIRYFETKAFFAFDSQFLNSKLELFCMNEIKTKWKSQRRSGNFKKRLRTFPRARARVGCELESSIFYDLF